jgi:hypothetical protein
VPKADATRVYNEYIQDELQHTVWTSCISWYHAGQSLHIIDPGTKRSFLQRTGDTRQGKLIATWPGTLTYMWWMMRTPIWKDYETNGGEKWIQRRRYLSGAKTTLEFLLMGAGLGTFALMKLGKWEQTRNLVLENARKLIN